MIDTFGMDNFFPYHHFQIQQPKSLSQAEQTTLQLLGNQIGLSSTVRQSQQQPQQSNQISQMSDHQNNNNNNNNNINNTENSDLNNNHQNNNNNNNNIGIGTSNAQ